MVTPHSEDVRGPAGITQRGFFVQADRDSLAAPRHRVPYALFVRIQGEQTSGAQESIHRRCGRDEGQSENVASQCLTVLSLQTAQGDQVDGYITQYWSSRNDPTMGLDRGDVDESAFGQRTLGISLLLFLICLGENFKRETLWVFPPVRARAQGLTKYPRSRATAAS